MAGRGKLAICGVLLQDERHTVAGAAPPSTHRAPPQSGRGAAAPQHARVPPRAGGDGARPRGCEVQLQLLGARGPDPSAMCVTPSPAVPERACGVRGRERAEARALGRARGRPHQGRVRSGERAAHTRTLGGLGRVGVGVTGAGQARTHKHFILRRRSLCPTRVHVSVCTSWAESEEGT